MRYTVQRVVDQWCCAVDSVRVHVCCGGGAQEASQNTAARKQSCLTRLALVLTRSWTVQ